MADPSTPDPFDAIDGSLLPRGQQGSVGHVAGQLQSSMASLRRADTGDLELLFNGCDRNKSGYVEMDEFEVLCRELGYDLQDWREVFAELDKDGDGRLGKEEFVSGFHEVYAEAKDTYRQASVGVNVAEKRRRLKSQGSMTRSLALANMLDAADMGFYLLDDASQEQVCEFYQHLHTTEEPQLMHKFEEILISVIRDMKSKQTENERLEKSFMREKESHEDHLRQLEEEMEAQVNRVEDRVRKEEKLKLEQEKEDLKVQLEEEIGELQDNLMKLQKMEAPHTEGQPIEDQRSRLDDMLNENLTLRSKLTDAQTNLTLLRSDVATLKHEYNNRVGQLENEKEGMLEFVQEHEHLSRHVYLLQDANKKLHDTNDDLRSALETTVVSPTQVHRRIPSALGYHRKSTGSTPSHSHSRPGSLGPMPFDTSRGEYVQEYVNGPSYEGQRSRPLSANSSLAEELGLMDSPSRSINNMKPMLISPLAQDPLVVEGASAHRVQALGMPSVGLLPAQDSCEVDSLPEDFDSGHGTMREMTELDWQDGMSGDDEITSSTPHKIRPMYHVNAQTLNQDEEDVVDGELGPEAVEALELEIESARPPSRCSSRASRTSSRSGRSHASQGRKTRRRLPQPQTLVVAEPERMYKVVLCGDAAVGKSSFILRLCKDTFYSNLNSTLGVDFHTKTLQVDGRMVALQLWDTAGQERFRSIAKSYFRRADGVLLLYDVCYERSFVNVRDWVEAVEDGAEKTIPMMIVGNKTDLRDTYIAEGSSKKCVRTEDGTRLAREFDALFIEASAKDGSNIMEAVTELSRLLRTNEDLEVKNVGMKLSMKDKDKSSCCS